MQRRCCCPPERRRAGWFRLSLTSSSRPARSSASSTAGRRAAREGRREPRSRRPYADVVEDAHREWVRLLKDHPDLAPQLGDVMEVDVVTVEVDRPAAGGRRGLIHETVERPQQRRLPAPGGADQREHLPLTDREVDALDRRLPGVRHAEVLGLHALLDLGALALSLPRRAEQAGCSVLDGLRCAVPPLRRLDDRRIVVHHDAADRRRVLQRAHGSLPFREIRSMTKFMAITIISRTNAAAYAFWGAFPSPAGELL